MRLTEYFRLIGAPPINAGATEGEISAAETRLGGRFPGALREWLRVANGFEGEAGKNIWRFPSPRRLHTIFEVFGQSEIVVERIGYPDRRMPGRDYIIVCDALIYLPFYAANIRPDSPHYAEILGGIDESGPGRSVSIITRFSASSFKTFENLLFEHPDDCLHDED